MCCVSLCCITWRCGPASRVLLWACGRMRNVESCSRTASSHGDNRPTEVSQLMDRCRVVGVAVCTVGDVKCWGQPDHVEDRQPHTSQKLHMKAVANRTQDTVCLAMLLAWLAVHSRPDRWSTLTQLDQKISDENPVRVDGHFCL